MQCTRWKVERRKNNEMEKHYHRKLIDQSTVETCKDRNQKELHCTRRKVERGNLIYPCYLFAVSAKTKWTTAKTCKNRNHKELQCTRRKVERGKLIYPRYLFAFSSHQIFKGIEDPGDPFPRRANTQAQSSEQACRDWMGWLGHIGNWIIWAQAL